MITRERLKELLYYHPESGDFVWLVDSSSRTPAGTQAGTPAANYIYITIDYTQYSAHRLAWFYMTGEWPDQVDHEDLCKINNVFTNLREATSAQNRHNCLAPTTNTSGIKGVYWYKKSKKWHAQLRANNVRYHLGYFDSKEAAAAAWREGATKFHGEFARYDG